MDCPGSFLLYSEPTERSAAGHRKRRRVLNKHRQFNQPWRNPRVDWKCFVRKRREAPCPQRKARKVGGHLAAEMATDHRGHRRGSEGLVGMSARRGRGLSKLLIGWDLCWVFLFVCLFFLSWVWMSEVVILSADDCVCIFVCLLFRWGVLHRLLLVVPWYLGLVFQWFPLCDFSLSDTP